MTLGCMLRGNQQPAVGIELDFSFKNVEIIYGKRGGLKMRAVLHRVIVRNVESSDPCHILDF
jgi:hypothetical protein